MDEGRIILIVMGIIFWVVRSILKNNKKKQNKPTAPKRTRPAKSTSKKSQNIDDIFKDFVKELEKKKQANQKPAPLTRTAEAKKTVKKQQQNINWQKVERTHIAPKKQLIDHEDYHGTLTIENSPIAESEGNIYEFDIDNIDFRDAIIAKEILDRKYT